MQRPLTVLFRGGKMSLKNRLNSPYALPLRSLKIEEVETLAFFFYRRGALRLAAGTTDAF